MRRRFAAQIEAVARAVNSPILLDTLEPDGVTRRYIGGVALNF